ncbi:MAG: DNA-3-methyladenine glycosylase [Bacteroidales bacterium]|nr:DNA-3-methyladenine glycosylase [Bacteroidales bacterium]
MSISKGAKLPLSFYLNDDVVHLAKSLLGKILITNIDGDLTSGIISETEAYNGIFDKASHAYNNRRTKRTEVMYATGGIAYVYFNYGMHHLFNVVTAKAETPCAVLIRGIIPLDGIDIQLKRRKIEQPLHLLANGPGKVCQALGINLLHNGISLLESTIWIEDTKEQISDFLITSGPRVGVSYAAEDTLLPYRFILNNKRYKPVVLTNKKA